MEQAIQNIEKRSADANTLTRLARSLASVRMPSATKHSSVGAGSFLVNLKNSFRVWIREISQADEADLVGLLQHHESQFPLVMSSCHTRSIANLSRPQ